MINGSTYKKKLFKNFVFHNIFKKPYLRSMKILYIDKWKMKSDVIFFNKNLIFLILYYTSAV